MGMFKNVNGEKVFKHGNKAYEHAIIAASTCPFFTLDTDEDELVTSVQQPSCYNCLFRKWTQGSFICMARRKP